MMLRGFVASLFTTVLMLSSGCVDNAMCVGYGDRHECSALSVENDCSAAPGCSWGDACAPVLCRTVADAAACAALPHCVMADGSCVMRDAPVTPCDGDNQSCGPSDRCAFATQCTGEAKPCTDTKSASECRANRLCQWVDPPDN